jgi:predicted DNA-binding transcriptional regulator AlpA
MNTFLSSDNLHAGHHRLTHVTGVNHNLRESKTVDLITADDIAQTLHLAVRTVREKVVRRPDFPRPIAVGGAKRWIRNEVHQWILKQRTRR